MSWIEEQSYYGLEEHIFECYDSVDYIKRGLWLTNSGITLKISEMTDSHLINSINRIERLDWRKDYLPLLKEELKRRKYGK